MNITVAHSAYPVNGQLEDSKESKTEEERKNSRGKKTD